MVVEVRAPGSSIHGHALIRIIAVSLCKSIIYCIYACTCSQHSKLTTKLTRCYLQAASAMQLHLHLLFHALLPLVVAYICNWIVIGGKPPAEEAQRIYILNEYIFSTRNLLLRRLLQRRLDYMAVLFEFAS